MQKRFTFKKEERLCSKIIIDRLFAEGKSVFSFPFKIIFLPVQLPVDDVLLQVVFSVPKRSFKHAVKRNLLRRRMREVYRLNKETFVSHFDVSVSQLAMMYIYVGKEILEYEVIEKGMIKGMEKLAGKLKATIALNPIP